MKISIASYSFHGLRADDMMDVFGYLETCRYRYGLDAADIWNGIIGSNPDDYLQEDFLRKLKSALDEREMTLVNYHVDGVHVWEDDPDAREQNYQGALKHLRAAEFLGAKTVRIDAGGKGLAFSDEQFDFIAQRYQEYAKLGEDGGFRVGPENHWGPTLNPNVMERLAVSVNSPAFGILFHIGHWEVGEEADGDRRLAPWAMHTHVDARVTRNCLEERIQILLDAGYQGYWGVEHHSAKNEYAEVEYQIAEVKRALVRLEHKPASEGSINPLLGF
jgi:sugar phosphate isomerase/epimerase